MPMIDVYAVAGTFRDPHALAQNLAAAVMRWEQVPDLPLFANNTAAFIHDMEAAAISNVAGESNYVRVQVLTPVGVLDREKQLGVVKELTDIVAAAAGDPDVRERRSHRSLREQPSERFALVESERRDVDEPDDVRRIRPERGDDLASIGVPDDDRRAVLEIEHLAQARDVVDERGQRELRRSHLKALCLEALDDAAPGGAVGPGSVDENDIWPAVHLRSSFARFRRSRKCRREPAPAHRTILRFVCSPRVADVDPRTRRGARGDPR